MVPLVRVLDLSPCGWSVLEVTQRWLVSSGTRPLDQHPVFCTSAPLVILVLSPSVSQALIRVSNAVDTMCPLSTLPVNAQLFWRKKRINSRIMLVITSLRVIFLRQRPLTLRKSIEMV